MRGAWKRQVWEATSWTEVRGPAGADFCEMKDLGVAAPSWQVLRMGDGRMFSVSEGHVPRRHLKDIDKGRQRRLLAKLAKKNMKLES